MTNNKPLGEWTLAEVKEYCKKRYCGDCLFCKNVGALGNSCVLRKTYPANWDLPESPRWSDEDVKDAKALLYLMPQAQSIVRNTECHLHLMVAGVLQGIELRADKFAGIKPGTAVALREIAEYKREG